MPAVTCRKCGAVVSVKSGPEDGLEVGCGSSFRESCKLLRGAAMMGNIGGVGECPDMREAIKRAHFRIARSATAGPALVAATAAGSTEASD